MTDTGTLPDNRASVYEEIGPNGPRFVYRASSLGQCLNALACARRGLTPALPPEDLQKRFDVGNEMEPVILARLKDRYGFEHYGHQSTVELDVGTSAVVRGHVDAFAPGGFEVTHFCGEPASKNPPPAIDIAVVDAKALAPSGIEKWLKEGWAGFPYYQWQQAMYALVPGYDGVVMALYNKLDGEMVIDYWPVEKIGISKVDILRRVLKIEELAKADLFIEECNPKQYPCPFYRLHPAPKPGTVSADGELVDVDMEALRELAVMRQAAKEREEAANAEKREIEEKIRTAFGQKPASAKFEDMTVTTFYGSTGTTDWDEIGNLIQATGDDAKARFSKSVKNIVMTVKITPKKDSLAKPETETEKPKRASRARKTG